MPLLFLAMPGAPRSVRVLVKPVRFCPNPGAVLHSPQADEGHGDIDEGQQDGKRLVDLSPRTATADSMSPKKGLSGLGENVLELTLLAMASNLAMASMRIKCFVAVTSNTSGL